RAAELVERRLGTVAAADVLLDEVDAVDRHVHAVAALVLEMQEVALGVGDVQVLQAAIEPDAVIDVHHEIAALELGEAREHVGAADLADGALLAALAEELLLADEDPRLDRQTKALRERALDEDRRPRARREKRRQPLARRRDVDAVRREET